jgi:hypothetical protein
VEQELALAARLRVGSPGLRIGPDVDAHQEDLAAADRGVGVGEAGLAGSERLHLRAQQRDPRLESV